MSRHNESEKRLPKSCLVALCKFEPVLCWTRECDNLLYQMLVEMLIPDVLRPIPSRSHFGDQCSSKTGLCSSFSFSPSSSSSSSLPQVP